VETEGSLNDKINRLKPATARQPLGNKHTSAASTQWQQAHNGSIHTEASHSQQVSSGSIHIAEIKQKQ
jgi:hypothetical protein